MIEDLKTAITLGFFLAWLLGPVFFVLLETSAIKGFRAALALDVGVLIADIVFILLAYLGTNRILERLKDDPGLFIFGGFILVVYGLVSFIKAQREGKTAPDAEAVEVQKTNYIGLAIKGFFLNFINIGVLGFWLGLIVIFSPKLENDPQRLFAFFSTVLLAYLATDILKILAAKRLKKYLTPTRILNFRKLIAVIMLICGAVLIAKGALPELMYEVDKFLGLAE